MPTFSDLARAAYCPRQLYYARREDDETVPDEARATIDLAFRYDDLRAASDETLSEAPIAVTPDAYRRALDALAERPDWESLCAPTAREVLLDGRDCRGIAHKLLAGEPPIPTLVSTGSPPETGVWEPQSVRAVAAALALAWERERSIPRALVEYPAVGVVRDVAITARRKATYRRVLRTVRAMEGPPPRIDTNRCDACRYRERCGVRTRSLKSLLGL
ncbi:CRISPR-associated protein Cas4 [Haloferacaceae archaeon DSL9]